MKKIILISLCVIFLIGGCGYQVGSLMHPQIKSVAIGNVKNETTAYNVGVNMQQLLSEQFMLDGSLKVKTRTQADVIVFSRIMNISFVEIAGRNYNDDGVYIPNEWQCKVDVEYSVIIPSRREPLINSRRVYGISVFRILADSETARRRAISQACRDAAKKIVQNTTEAW